VNGQYPNVDVSQLRSVVEAFVTTVDDLYGHHLDSTAGFTANHKLMIRAQEEIRNSLPPEIDLDQLEFFYGHGNPNDPSNRLLHKTTQGEFKRRNAKGGRNHVRAGQLLLVLIYAFWEHEYRPPLAAALGLADQNDLKLPLLGDLRLLRRDIIHHRGIATKETVTRLSAGHGFEEGSEINLSGSDLEELIRKIKGAMDELVVQAGGTDPLHRTLWHVQ